MPKVWLDEGIALWEELYNREGEWALQILSSKALSLIANSLASHGKDLIELSSGLQWLTRPAHTSAGDDDLWLERRPSSSYCFRITFLL
jgi:hypothetical protein